MKRARWVCFEALIALVLLHAPASRASEPVQRLDQAEFVLDESASPPADSAGWRTVSLPDFWEDRLPGQQGVGWYRLQWPLSAVAGRPPALFLPKAGYATEAYVNGRLVGRSGTRERPDLHGHPRLYAIDPSLLHEGGNTIHLRMEVMPFFGGVLNAPLVADADTLSRAQDRDTLLLLTGPKVLCGVATMLGLVMLGLWSRRPKESTFGYFGVATLAYAVWLLAWVFDAPPVSIAAVVGVLALASQSCNVATSVFALRYGGWHLPRLEAALWVTVPIVLIGGLGAYALPATSPQAAALLDRMAYIQAPVFVGYTVVLALNAWRRRTADSVALLLASPGCTVQWVLGVLGYYDAARLLLPYSFVALFLTIGWILVGRFARSLDESELLNAQLEARVEAKHAELERNYARMEQMTRQVAVVAERQRIMSDMHDGIGGQLISTLSLVEHGAASKEQVSAALRECIDDLRLAIDSLEPSDDDLLPVLGNLRYRLEGRLKQRGIALDWQVGDVPKLACLTPANVLHVLRILQEAFTNVLKHARASRICVDTRVDAGRVSINVSDDGQGFDDAVARQGHGLVNMRERARKIGGELLIAADARGTTLSLSLPIG